MTSPLPPKRRDTRSLEDLIRQDRVRIGQLDRGLAFGKFPPARPLKARFDDDAEDDADLTDEIQFINTDRASATVAGTITLKLTYLPLDGSLHIRWNGLDQPPTEWTLNGQTVTFVSTHIRVGDVLSAAYAYLDPGDPAVVGPLMSLSLRGTTTRTGALPTATVVGDFVVIAVYGGSAAFTDPRFPLFPTSGTTCKVYAGTATDLSTLAPSSGSGSYIVVAAFVGGATVDQVAFNVDPAHAAVPAQPGTAAIGIGCQSSSFVAGAVQAQTPPWTPAATDTGSPQWAQVSVYYWFDATATNTPTNAPGFTGGVNETEAFIITLLDVAE